ncbi:F-box only [Labeo rohita]|uniref:F-box only n=1 Tax=Labeo rohita TaxID=84645 RepID=A0A498MU68_LABRO|nr:F-box only [Labeo rohita]
MEKNFNEQLLELREQSKQNKYMIASLAKAVQYNADEVKDCKEKISDLEKCNERLCKENKELKERMREQERCKMRWCLKIKGLKEEKDKSIRPNVIQLFNKIAPDMEERQLEEAIDVLHRVGRKDDNRKRHIVVLFVLRHVKEELWRRCKDSPVCREKGIRLVKMLLLEDREQESNCGLRLSP